MTKGAYDVSETYVGPTKDGSFRSCLCAMLVFLSICVIILIVAWPWKNSEGYGKPAPGNYGSAEQQYGDNYQPNKKKENDKKKENESDKRPEVNEVTTLRGQGPDKDDSGETVTTGPDFAVDGIKRSGNKSEKIINSSDRQPQTTTVPVTIPPTDGDNNEENTNNPSEPVTPTETPETAVSDNVNVKQKNEDNLPGVNGTNKTENQDEDEGGQSTTVGSASQNEDGTTTQQPEGNKNALLLGSIKDKNGTNKTENQDEDEGGQSTTVGSASQNEDDTTTQQPEGNKNALLLGSKKDKNGTNKTENQDEDESGLSTTVGSASQNGDDTTTQQLEGNKNDLLLGSKKDKNGTNKTENQDEDEGGQSTTVGSASQDGNDATTQQPEGNKNALLLGSKKDKNGTNKTENQDEDEGGQSTTVGSASQDGNDATTQQPEGNKNALLLGSKKDKNGTNKTENQNEDEAGQSTTVGSASQDEDEATTQQPESNKNAVLLNSKKDNNGTNKTENQNEDEAGQSTTVGSASQDEDEATTQQPESNKNAVLLNSKKDNNGTNKTENQEDDEVHQSTTVSSASQNEDGKTEQSEGDENETDKARNKKENQQNDDSTTIPPTDSVLTTSTPEATPKKSLLGVRTLSDENTTEKEVNETTTLPSSFRELTQKEPTARPEIMETEGVVQSRVTLPPKNQNIVDECHAECRKVGARILSRMNHLADPCEQFYDYACGGDNGDNAPEDNWKRIAAGLDRVRDNSPKSFKTFKKFYDSCVDFHVDFDFARRVDEAKHILSTVGQPLEEDADEKSALTDLLTQLLQLDSSPLFDISVDIDKESQHFIFQLNIGKRFSTFGNDNNALSIKRKCIHQGKKHFDFSLSLFDFINLNDMYKVYTNCRENETYSYDSLLVALDIFEMDGVEFTDTPDHIQEILNKFKELLSAANIRKTIVTKNFQIRKVSEVVFHYPLIDWKQIFKNLVGTELHDEDWVQVYFPEFFLKMFSRKQTMSRRALYNAILAMYAHDLYTNLVLPTQMSDPEEFCLQQSSDLMKEVASSMYLESINVKDIEEDLVRVQDLFAKMKIKLEDMIQEAEWADVTMQNILKKKLKSMNLETWSQSLIWKNVSLIEQRMESVERDFGNYSDFAAALVRRNRRMLYNMWDKMGYEEENIWWHFITPYSTQPVSIYALNTIVIPPAMLFTRSKEIPRYVSLAKLGFSVAKAIGYHFDYTGSKYQMRLDNKAETTYNETNTCNSVGYVNKTVKMEFAGKNIGFEVNEDSFQLSINEQFVENMAINLLSLMSDDDVNDYQISWFAQNHISDVSKTFLREKVFFIALAQEHCRKPRLDDFFLHLFENEHLPPSILLDNALSHSKQFNDVFLCREGARMDARFKCKAFPDMPFEDYVDEY